MTTTTTNPLFAGLSEKEVTRTEWARLAARRGKELRWTWESLARILTRNPNLKVEFTGGTPRTDGNTIWLRIPIELGDPTPHVRNGVCGKRDENELQRCPACKVLEDVETTMYHEIAHITADSFAKMSEREQVQVLKDAYRLEAGTAPEGTRMKKLLKLIQNLGIGASFVVASKVISPWFGILLNVAEDGRVNKYMMDARPGTRKMFKAQTYSIFVNGIQRPDGSVMKWSEQPVNMQALIMLYCKIFQLDYTGWFDERVIGDLDDYRINKYCERLANCRSVNETYRLCIPVLERLRELGYCKSPEDEEDDPKPEGKGEPEEEPESGESDEEAQGDGAGSGGESAPDDDEAEDDQSGGSDDTSDDSNGPETPAKDDESEEDESSSGDSESDDDAGEEDAGDESSSDEEGTEQSDGDDTGNGDGEDTDEEDGEGAGSSDESDDGEDSDHDADDQSDGDADGGDAEDSEDFEGEGPEEYTGLEYGEPDECKDGFDKFGRHDPDGEVTTSDTYADRNEVERAIAQEEHFDAPSRNVWGVNVHENEEDGLAWTDRYGRGSDTIIIPESILAPALAKLRVVFTDNKKGAHQRNLERGDRISGRWMGQRIPTEDYRIFERKIKPGKKDWFVLIGLDVSGSTSGSKLKLIKQAAYAKAELCNRLGVKFAVYAHTGAYNEDHPGTMDLDMYVVKSPEQRWDTDAQHRLCSLQPASANLDGHTLEFYRKVIERQRATDKIVLYYTDGAMPLENFDEELVILQREILNLQRMRVGIVGVGIKTDSPTKHGLDTIRLDSIEDVPRVVVELERRLQG